MKALIALSLLVAIALTACGGAVATTVATVPTAAATTIAAIPTLDAGPTQTIGALMGQVSSLQATLTAPTTTPLPPTATPTRPATATATTPPLPPTPTRTIAPTAIPTQASGAKVGQTANGQGFAVTLHELLDPAPPQQYFKPGAGMRWVSIDVSIKNTGTKPIGYNPFYFKLKSADNREYTATIGGVDPALKSGDHQPGEASRGWVTFEVPEGMALATVTYDPTFGSSRATFDLR